MKGVEADLPEHFSKHPVNNGIHFVFKCTTILSKTLQIEVSKSRQKVLEETAKNEEVKKSFQSKLMEYETQLQIEFTNKEQNVCLIQYRILFYF